MGNCILEGSALLFLGISSPSPKVKMGRATDASSPSAPPTPGARRPAAPEWPPGPHPGAPGVAPREGVGAKGFGKPQTLVFFSLIPVKGVREEAKAQHTPPPRERLLEYS